MLLPKSFSRLLAGILLTLWPMLASAAINITHEPEQALSSQAEWCQSAPSMSIAQVATGGCNFTPTDSQDNLLHKASADAYWLRISLHNPEPEKINRWLRVGHPRLQFVTLYAHDAEGRWHRTDTGLSVPSANRAIVDPYPILPISLASGETKTFYLRVLSESPIDLNAELWEPDAYHSAQHLNELFQVMTLGCLMLAAVFTLMVFFKTRELAYLYFAATLLSECAQDAGYTGLLQAYLWPGNWSYFLPFQSVTNSLVVGFFVLFTKSFLSIRWNWGLINRFLLFFSVVLGLCVLWGCLVNYRQAMLLLPIAIVGIVFSNFCLVFITWRDGSKLANYLMISYAVLLPILFYRVLSIYGFVHYSIFQSLGISTYLLIISPIILAGLLKRTEELHVAMINSRADVSARIKFVAQMSHELRTPLNSILGYAELQARGIQPGLMQAYASEIKHHGRYLLGMIDEILELSRGEAGQLKLDLAPLNLTSFVATLSQSAEISTQKRGNRFIVLSENLAQETLMLDERHLRQILDNLVSNANRYTNRGCITLSYSVTLLPNGRFKLAFGVSDTGAGITDEEIQTIFQPFVRGSAAKASGIDGTGMGLAIVQQLLRLMGSEIQVKSQLNIGSEFLFSLECAAAAKVELPVSSRQGLLPKQYKLLIVDDDQLNRQLLLLLLSEYGFNILTANSGNTARQFIGDCVALVVTDQFMPDGDGWSVLKDWAKLEVPVLLLSAAPPQRPLDFPDSLQFSRIQLKPFDADNLLAAISEVLAIAWQPEEYKPDPITENLLTPPPELLEQLREMIDEGRVTDIDHWCHSFPQKHSEYTAYCAKIAETNARLDFEALRELAACRT